MKALIIGYKFSIFHLLEPHTSYFYHKQAKIFINRYFFLKKTRIFESVGYSSNTLYTIGNKNYTAVHFRCGYSIVFMHMMIGRDGLHLWPAMYGYVINEFSKNLLQYHTQKDFFLSKLSHISQNNKSLIFFLYYPYTCFNQFLRFMWCVSLKSTLQLTN